jgi:hypothetical protein
MGNEQKKSDEEYRREFNRLHDEFIHGKKEFVAAEDYSSFRKKKSSKSKLKHNKKCKCK